MGFEDRCEADFVEQGFVFQLKLLLFGLQGSNLSLEVVDALGQGTLLALGAELQLFTLVGFLLHGLDFGLEGEDVLVETGAVAVP